MKRRICKIVLSTMILSFMSLAIGCSNKPKKLDDFEKYAQQVEDIEIPENVRIVGLGEATHGNHEFQKLKLDVFQHLVETTNTRAFVLEGDFGGCMLINQYVQTGEGDLDEVTKLLGYRIYRTDEMRDLIQWMREYNQTAEETEKVRIYGMDMQYGMRCAQIIKDYLNQVDTENASTLCEQIDKYLGTEEDGYNPQQADAILEFLDQLEGSFESSKDAYKATGSEQEYEIAKRSIVNIKYYITYREKENFGAKYRDTCMKENVDWILNQEESFYQSKIMVSGHNGHMTRNQSSNYTFLGKFLADEYRDSYYVIGTDYYKTNCNMPGKGGRVNATFCSDDPLAYQVGQLAENQYYLDFAKASESEELSEVLNKQIATGSLSESYSFIMKFLKNTTQIYFAPTEMYDSMIFVYEATPITIWE